MRGSTIFYALLLLAPLGAMAEAPPTGKLSDDALPLGYALHLTVDPRAERFMGQAHIRVKLAKASDHLWLHARELDVTKVEYTAGDGKKHAAQFGMRDPSGVAEITLGATLPPQTIELSLEYSAPFNAKLQGLYKVKVGDDAYVMTQMESVSARYAFPGFDEPRFKTPFDVTLTVPKDEVAVANTRLVSEKTKAGWKTLTFAQTRPLPTYLVAFAVGPWDVAEGPPLAANAVRKHALPLRALGPRGTAPQLKWILEQTPATVQYYENYTQQPYPFDKLDLLAAPDFSAGAMENAGLIVYRDALLRLDAHSSSAAYRSSFIVNAHEIAHQWFGDLVTVPWWDDIWLNEAFATWAEGKATVALKPEYLGELEDLDGTHGAMRADSRLSARKIRQPIAGQGDIENAFDGITYEKGAAVLRMFEEWVGEDVYRAAMRDYLAAHKFGSGSSDDLIDTIARVSGKGEALKAAMRSFLDQPGLPQVHSELKCNDGKATLALSQSRYLPFGVMSSADLLWHMPVCARFGHDGQSEKQCFLLEQPQQEFAVAGSCAQWYLPNADGAGYYRFTMAESDSAALRAHTAALSPAEQLVYADAIGSAFMQGSVTPAALLDAMPAFAKSDVPQIATALFGGFDWIHEHLATDTTRPLLEAYAAKLYAPRLDQLGLHPVKGESDATTSLRTELIGFLALTAKEPTLRGKLNAEGRAALGLDGNPADLTRLDPELRGTALRIAVQDGGEPAYQAALTQLAGNHQTRQRYELLGALGSTHDPKLGAQARDFGLTPAVAVGEMRSLYSGQGERENRAAFWSWFQTHFDALRARMPDEYQRSLPYYAAAGRCSKEQADDLRSWFAPRIQQVLGGQRTLAQTLEGIEQCGALRAHLGDAPLAAWTERMSANAGVQSAAKGSAGSGR